MVDLPRVPRRLALVEEPKSSLTRGDIEAPYQIFARDMNDVGGALDTFAKTHAEDAGRNAVTTDAEGNLQVQRLPFVGDSATLFDRGVKAGAMARADGQADRDLLDLREKFQNDPDGFRKAADAYRDQKVATANGVSSAVGTALRSSIESRTTSIYGGLLSQFRTNELHRAHESIDARLTAIGDDMEVLARNGGANSDEFKRLTGNMDALLKEKTGNPLFRYPAEKADLFRDAMITRAQGAAVLEQTERVYKERGFEAARDYLRGTVREMEKTLKQSNKIEQAGMAWLRAEEAGFRADRDVISREWSSARPQAATLPRDSLIDLYQRALSVGNHRVAFDIDAHMKALDLVGDIRSLPPGERAVVAVTGNLPQNLSATQAQTRSLIENEARRQGVDPKLATAIAVRESSLNPGAAATTSSARGLFQLLSADRQRLGVAEGAGVEDQVRGGITKVKETINELRSQLGREPTPAEVYMGHFQGSGIAAAIIRANPDADLKETINRVKPGWGDKVFAANPFLQNIPTVGAFRDWAGRAIGAEGGDANIDLTQSRAGLLALGMMKKDMAREVGNEIGELRKRLDKEEFPPLDQVVSLGEKVHAIGTPDQQREVNELVAIAKVGQQFQKLSAPDRAQAISEANDQLKSGAAKFDARLRDVLAKSDRDITQAYKTDPYGAFYRYSRSEAAKPTPAMDMSQPAQMAAVSDFRVKQQAVMRAEEGLGPVSIFRPAEAEAFRGALAQADAKQTAGLMAVLGRLPDDVLGATLDNPDVKGAIAGASRSTDPAKYQVAMTSLDQLYARDPHRFTRVFGEDAWHALASWQSNLRYMDPKTLADERARLEDPSQAAARKKAEEKGHEEARKETPDKVVKQFDQSWSVTPGFVARNVTGSQPLAPVDSGTRNALMGDFDTVYSRRYAETQDKDVAMKQTIDLLRTKWQRSHVNGGTLMLRAPESVYPAIGGSYDWMKPQVEADLEQRIGVPRQQGSVFGQAVLGGAVPVVGPGLTAGSATNWDYTLVTDRQTETEAQRYDKAQPLSNTNKAPTYQVLVRDNRRQNPQWDVVRGADGRAMRYGFDPGVARAEARVGYGQRRENVQALDAPMQANQAERARQVEAIRESIQGSR